MSASIRHWVRNSGTPNWGRKEKERKGEGEREKVEGEREKINVLENPEELKLSTKCCV